MSAKARQLHADHITAFYHGGATEVDNAQTLCLACNGAKGEDRVSFRTAATRADEAPRSFPELGTHRGFNPRDMDQWAQFVRRYVNLFYRCAAVHEVDIAARGTGSGIGPFGSGRATTPAGSPPTCRRCDSSSVTVEKRAAYRPLRTRSK